MDESIGRRWEREARDRLPSLLAEWTGVPTEEVKASSVERCKGDFGIDLVVEVGARLFLVEVKGRDDIAMLDRAAAQLSLAMRQSPGGVPLVVVPFMGPMARDWAKRQGISWADLSGNADVRTTGLRVLIQGEGNQFAVAGRPSNPFTPRFARVSRALLVEPDRWWRQADLAPEIGVPAGTVSKVVQRLAELELVVRDDEGRIRARAPSLLLDAWAQHYRFADHDVRRYHAVGRTGPAILKGLAEKLDGAGQTWAATGLSAAWMYTRFADFRISSILVERHPAEPESLGLRPVEQGENVWMIVPHDEGAFYKKVQQGLWCAHPVQVYLDLLGHPERAAEAAEALRNQWMSWRT